MYCLCIGIAVLGVLYWLLWVFDCVGRHLGFPQCDEAHDKLLAFKYLHL
jgi:hypothetical protein